MSGTMLLRMFVCDGRGAYLSTKQAEAGTADHIWRRDKDNGKASGVGSSSSHSWAHAKELAWHSTRGAKVSYSLDGKRTDPLLCWLCNDVGPGIRLHGLVIAKQ
jgi:hypothetical protein